MLHKGNDGRLEYSQPSKMELVADKNKQNKSNPNGRILVRNPLGKMQNTLASRHGEPKKLRLTNNSELIDK